MATQFEYFGFRYEIIEGKNNEVALIEAHSDQERAIVPKTVEHKGSLYIVTKIGKNKRYWNGYDYKESSYACGAFSACKFERSGSKTKLTNDTLKSVLLPDTITEIDEYAFERCKSLETINIPTNVTHIGYCAFSNCINIKELRIPDSVTTIDKFAFYHCESLEKINIPKSINSIPEHAFSYCYSLKKIEIPSTITSIQENAFENAGLNEIIIPSSIKTIAKEAFYSKKAECGARQINDIKTVNILNDEWGIIVHPEAFPPSATVNYLGIKASKPKKESDNLENKTSDPVQKIATPKPAISTPAISIDLEKLIQAALVDGVVTDKERAILIKKVKESGGDTDEFELLLDARIYETQKKNAQKKEKETPKAEKKVVEKIEEPKKEKETPKEVKQTAKSASSTAPGRDVWENMEKDVKPALQILDRLVAGMPYVQDGTYLVNYDSKSYIGFSQNGKAKNFATFAPQPKALVVNAWGMADSEEIETVGKALPNFEHKVTSRNVSFHTFKFPVDKALTAEQVEATLAIMEMARKNYEK